MLNTLDGPWLICAALLVLVVVVQRGPRPQGRDLVLIATLTAGAAAARLIWGQWGPLHVNGQGPLWIRGALEPSVLSVYGPGYFELFTRVAPLGPAPDLAVFAVNALLSALSPALLYATARLTGVERGGALAAAAVLAADVVSIRTAASEGYFSSLVVLVLAVQVSLALGLQAQLRRDRVAACLALGAAGLLASAAARIHAAGYLPLALSPLVVLSSAEPEGRGTRFTRVIVAAAVIGAAVLLTSGQTIMVALSTPMASHAVGGLARQDWELVLILLAVVLSMRAWAKPPLLPLLGICSLVAMLATQNSFQQHPLWKLSYQRLFWPGMLLGAAPLVPRRMQSTGWALASAAAVTALVLVVAPQSVGGPTTEQLEYRFLQETLRAMPPDCTVAGVNRVGKRIWEIPSYLVPGASAQRTVVHPSDLDAAPGNCLLYVRSSLCASLEARALCDAVEREARLERVTGRVFPSAPSYDGLPYDRPEVETVVFRVTGQRVGVSDGAAITPAFAQSLYDRLTTVRGADGCRLIRLDTTRFRITVELETSTGTRHAVEVATAPNAAGGWALAASADVQRDCGAMLAALQHALGDIGAPAAPNEMEPTG